MLVACSADGESLEPEPVAIPEYDRSDWHKRWYDLDRDCQDTRQEVLIAESVKPVTLDDRGCRVVTGSWDDPYTGETYTDPSILDIDHFVPLHNAHYSGGWMWSSEQRKAFANDLDFAKSLIAVYRGANRSKGSKGPEAWLPTNEAYRCEYVQTWVAVKEKWDLTLTARETRAIAALNCPDW